jgi:hypothetical protein
MEKKVDFILFEVGKGWKRDGYDTICKEKERKRDRRETDVILFETGGDGREAEVILFETEEKRM